VENVMPKTIRGDVAPRGRVRVHAASTPPRTNASKPVRRARLSADPKVERSAWMEIEGLLAAAHRRLEQQFSRAAKIGAKDADSLAQAGQRLLAGLRSHFDLKVGSLYPVLYETLADAGVILEAEIEIEVACDLMRRLDGMKPFDERYQPTLNILGSWLDRHLEQERARLFAAARRAQPAFARRMPDMRAKFAVDAAVLGEAPASTGSAGELQANGRVVTQAKPPRRPRVTNGARGRAVSPAAGFLN
jgi:hypothetical protein